MYQDPSTWTTLNRDAREYSWQQRIHQWPTGWSYTVWEAAQCCSAPEMSTHWSPKATAFLFYTARGTLWVWLEFITSSPVLSRGTQWDHKEPYKREAGAQSLRRICNDESRSWSDAGPRGKEWGQPLEAGKGKKMDLPLGPPEGQQSSQPRSSGILTSRTVRI